MRGPGVNLPRSAPRHSAPPQPTAQDTPILAITWSPGPAGACRGAAGACRGAAGAAGAPPGPAGAPPGPAGACRARWIAGFTPDFPAGLPDPSTLAAARVRWMPRFIAPGSRQARARRARASRQALGIAPGALGAFTTPVSSGSDPPAPEVVPGGQGVGVVRAEHPQ